MTLFINRFFCGIFMLFLISQSFIVENVSAEPIKFNGSSTLIGHHDIVLSIAWSPNGKFLASGSYDGSIKIWDMNINRNILNFSESTDQILSLAWNPDNIELASGSSNGNITIWNIETGMKKMIIRGASNNHTTRLAWNPNGTILASGNSNGSIILYDFKNDSILRIIKEPTSVRNIEWNKNGTQLFSVANIAPNIDSTSIKYWNILTGHALKNYSFSSGMFIWNPNETELACTDNYYGGKDLELIDIGLFDNQSPEYVKADFNFSSQIKLMVFNPDGENIAILLDESINVIILNIPTKKTTNVTYSDNNSGHYRTIEWSPDGKELATGFDNDIFIDIENIPKIQLISITVDKNNITIGDSFNITVILKNLGPFNYQDIKMNLFDGPILLNTSNLYLMVDQTKSIKYLWRTNNTISFGFHNIRAVVLLEEINITVVINPIPKANTYIIKMFVDKMNISIGETAIITAMIANNGTADAINITVSFYTDKLLLKILRENITKGGTITINLKWNTKNMNLGDHVLTVAVGNSSKQTTVHVKQGPAKLLGLSFPVWILILLILVIIGIVITYGYIYYQKQKKILE